MAALPRQAESEPGAVDATDDAPSSAPAAPLPEQESPIPWQLRAIALVDLGLDTVRVITATLAVYQLSGVAGAPRIPQSAVLEALELWHLCAIYATSVVLSLALARARTAR